MTLLQDGLIAFLSAVGVTMLVWIVAGVWVVNGGAGLLRRPALRALDEDCDPEPLLELCRYLGDVWSPDGGLYPLRRAAELFLPLDLRRFLKLK